MKKRELRKTENFKEENLYSFFVKKEIDFDDENFYVLESEFGTIHLLIKKYYTNYNITIGKSIECYVDKINCAGEIFLEPVHPFYKLGKVYEFELIGSGTKKFKGIVEFGLFVLNRYGEECFVVCSREFAKEVSDLQIINLKLLRIKKGSFRFEIPQESDFRQKLC